MILPSSLAPPTTWQVGWFRCPAPGLAEWLATDRLDPAVEWEIRPVSAPTLADLCRLLRAEGDRDRERRRRIPVLRHLLVPFPGWTAYLNDARHGTDAQTHPPVAAARLGCRAIRAISAERNALKLYEPGGECRRSIRAGAPTYPETNAERLPFEEPQEHVPGRRNRERFTKRMLERYLIELGVPVDAEPDLASALLVEAGPWDEEAAARAAHAEHLELFPEFRPDRLLGGGLSPQGARTLLRWCREEGATILGLEGYEPAEWARPPDQRDPQFVYDLSEISDDPAESVERADATLIDWEGEDWVWSVYGLRRT